MSIEHFNKVAHDWDRTRTVSKTVLSDFLSRCPLKKYDKVLDVGCGTGVLKDYIPDDVTYTGIDYAEAMIEIAKEKFADESGTWLVGDVQTYPFKSQFDVVYCYSVFPHFMDQRAVLGALRNLLVDGGYLYIFHSTSKEFLNVLHRNLPKKIESTPLAPATAVGLLVESCGFKVIETIDSSSRYMILAQKASE